MLKGAFDRDRVMVDAERGSRSQAQGRHRENAATGAHIQHLFAAAYLVLQPRQQQLGRGMETGSEGALGVDDKLYVAGSGTCSVPALADEDAPPDANGLDGSGPYQIPIPIGNNGDAAAAPTVAMTAPPAAMTDTRSPLMTTPWARVSPSARSVS